MSNHNCSNRDCVGSKNVSLVTWIISCPHAIWYYCVSHSNEHARETKLNNSFNSRHLILYSLIKFQFVTHLLLFSTPCLLWMTVCCCLFVVCCVFLDRVFVTKLTLNPGSSCPLPLCVGLQAHTFISLLLFSFMTFWKSCFSLYSARIIFTVHEALHWKP